tara:strand:+ start:516 stop:935 length:420 start_codon:yes stop_codon:yes gene_type:complete
MADLVSKSKTVSNKSKYSDLDLFLNPHPITKDITVKSDTDAIKRSVKNIVLTNYYERPFKPSLGGGVRNLMFELNTSRRIKRFGKQLRKVISDFEPRVSDVSVLIDDASDRNALNINIGYVVKGDASGRRVEFNVSRVR